MAKQGMDEKIRLLLSSECPAPSEVLGIHKDGDGYAIRAFAPGAKAMKAVVEGKPRAMKRIDDAGLFELKLPKKPAKYLLSADGGGLYEDPYGFGHILTDFDLHLIGEGKHYDTYEKLGAHIRVENGVKGAHFALWAPNAMRISIVGDFNNWDGRVHPMNRRHSGIWELFMPGIGEGAVYKYEIRYGGNVFLKTDPYGFFTEIRPQTASIVWDIEKYAWADEEWMNNRPKQDWLASPMSVYEVHLGSWMRAPEEGNRFLTYRELAETLVPYASEMGYTHLELMPVSEHPLDESWGYQPIGYYAATSRFGTPEDFMHFVDRCHQEGLGVIIDWVPAHFPKDAHGLAHFDGTFLYEHEDPRQREHRDWGTHIFNYGRNEVRNFLLSNALFWLKKYHIDGLRVDAVSSMLYLDYSKGTGDWLPNKYGGNEYIEAIDFIRRFNELCHRDFPGVLTIAEESTAWPMVSRPTYLGGLGFSLKWNMGWMHDMLEYFTKDPIHRKFHQNSITFGLLYAFNENFVLSLSHDEVVHGKRALLDKMPGDLWQRFANMRLLFGYMFGHPGKKLHFMGGEFGQWNEWYCGVSLDWHLLKYDNHRFLQTYVTDLNRLLRSEPSLYELDFEQDGFQWIDFSDSEASVVSFIRRAKNPDDFLIIVCNFTPVLRHGYRIGVPHKGVYREVLNSDSAIYGGSNAGNGGFCPAEAGPHLGWPASLCLTLPPLAMLVLKPVR